MYSEQDIYKLRRKVILFQSLTDLLLGSRIRSREKDSDPVAPVHKKSNTTTQPTENIYIHGTLVDIRDKENNLSNYLSRIEIYIEKAFFISFFFVFLFLD